MTERSRIVKLRARGGLGSAAALAVRRRVEGADIEPRGLPPASILLVRHLRDPLPRGLSGSARAVRPDPAWEDAVRDELEARHRAAARPVRGVITGEPVAVLFTDQAEMIACHALDLVSGDALRRWWWRPLLGASPGLSAARRLCRAWCDRAAYVPAAIDLLTRWHRVSDVLGRLAPAEAAAILSATCRALDAEDLAPTGIDVAEGVMRSAVDDGRAAAVVDTSSASMASIDRTVVPPWDDLHGVDASRSLGREHVALLGIALTHRRRPARLRTDRFRATFLAWWAAQRIVPSRGEPLPADRVSSATPSATDAGSTAPLDAAPAVDEGTGTRARRPDEASAASSLAGDQPMSLPSAPIDVTPGRAPADAELDNDPGAPTVFGAQTAFAGVLFLLNVMEHLDLPGCFEPAWPLGPWATLDVLARALVRGDDARVTHDPIWSVLATLDGRPPEVAPTLSAPPPDDHRLPARWMREPMVGPATEWRWAIASGRLRVWSRDGFVVADIGCGHAGTARDATHVLAGYGLRPSALGEASFTDAPIELARTALVRSLDDGLRRWASLVAPYVRRRITLAVGGDPDAPSRVLECAGRVHVTSSHVDVVMAMNDASVAVRRAGLDRDPGWRPALGRVVLFHFH